MGIEEKFISTINNYNLFSKNDKLLVGVSGGVDSVVLAFLLKKFDYNFSIAHCNFKLRGDESDQEELFVENLSKHLNVTFFKISFNTISYAKENKLSIQEAARLLRYNFFQEIAQKYNFNYILTAHNYDDNIETFFINLFRSTGLFGLRGIPLKNYNIVRPLLFITRQEIHQYAKNNNINWCEDSSNTKSIYLRNAIRHELLPVLNKIEKKFHKNFKRTFQNIIEHVELYISILEKVKTECLSKIENYFVCDLNALKKYKNYYLILSYILRDFGFNTNQVKQMMNSSKTGKVFYSKNYEALIDKENLLIREKIKNINLYFLIENENNLYSTFDNLPFKLIFEIKDVEEIKNFKTDRNVALLDYEKIKFPLVVRKWKAGDRFTPFGMHGSKKISDYLTDKKVNRFEKDNVWLLISNNIIAWVIGFTINDKFKITEKTKKVLMVKYFNK